MVRALFFVATFSTTLYSSGNLRERRSKSRRRSRRTRVAWRDEAVCIHSFTDGNGGDYFAGVGIHDGHEFVVASDEQAAVLGVDRQAGRGFAGFEWPLVQNCPGARVDLKHETFVFNIVVDVALAVGHGKFRFAAAEGDRQTGNSRVPALAASIAVAVPARPLKVKTRFEADHKGSRRGHRRSWPWRMLPAFSDRKPSVPYYFGRCW